jgi:hypothetical protein
MSTDNFENQMYLLNEEFIEFEIRWLQEFIRFVPAHRLYRVSPPTAKHMRKACALIERK